MAGRWARRLADRVVPVFRGERVLAVRARRLLALLGQQYRASGAAPLQVPPPPPPPGALGPPPMTETETEGSQRPAA